MKAKQKSTKGNTSTRRRYEAFTDEERSAMKDRVQELKVDKAEGESVVLAKIAEMDESDRAMAERVHAIITESVPSLTAKLWYGMPAYARDGKLVCFFQPAQKFKTRYAQFSFNDAAHLDEGNMWPTSYALLKLTPAVEKQIAAVVKKAAG